MPAVLVLIHESVVLLLLSLQQQIAYPLLNDQRVVEADLDDDSSLLISQLISYSVSVPNKKVK